MEYNHAIVENETWDSRFFKSKKGDTQRMEWMEIQCKKQCIINQTKLAYQFVIFSFTRQVSQTMPNSPNKYFKQQAVLEPTFLEQM